MKEADQSQPGPMESMKILFRASRGYWMVNLANFGDGVAYFGMLALMTLFMELNVGMSANGATSSIGMWLIYGLIALILPIGLIVARRWLLRGVRNEGVGT